MSIDSHLRRSLNAIKPTVDTLSCAHRSRDAFVVEHAERVAAVATGIGRAMGIHGGRLEILRVAALLHDIGKIAVPASILGKPGSLTGPEYTLVKEHSLTGYRILQNLQTQLPIAEIAYQHHERMDGSGYPRGLSGDDILREARIIAVADMFDAMTANRAYRPGLPRDFVLAEIQAGAGTKFDPAVVAALIETQLDAGKVKARLPAA